MASVASGAFTMAGGGARTRETLPRYGIDRAADAFVRGCLLGLRAPSRAELASAR